jgi:hypothetical protein
MPLLTMADGRTLDYAVSRPDDGLPLVFQHGTPGSLTPRRTLQRVAVRTRSRRARCSPNGSPACWWIAGAAPYEADGLDELLSFA